MSSKSTAKNIVKLANIDVSDVTGGLIEEGGEGVEEVVVLDAVLGTHQGGRTWRLKKISL